MNEELSREALLIYLNDLRTMETIIYESKAKIAEIEENDAEKKKSFVQNMPVPEKPQDVSGKSNENIEENKKKDKKIIIYHTIFSTTVLELFLLILFAGFNTKSDMVPIIMSLIITAPLSLVSYIIFKKGIIKKSRAEFENNKNKYNRKMRDYERKMKEYEENNNKKEAYHEYHKKTVEAEDKINEDITDISEKLQEAYNANIVPLQFRDIYGAAYLYDYLSISGQGLSEALMQANLDAIKNKLDSVLKLQAESIIQQAKANAAMTEQNRQILETAKTEMNNTDVAAKYAKIAAINSEISQKLQQKQLAYQTADFLLN